VAEALATIRTYEVCGVPIAALTPQAAAQAVVDAAQRGGPFQVHLCNAYTLSLVDSDPALCDALRTADANLPDGAPVAWLGRVVGTTVSVRGPGLVGDVARLGAGLNLRHFLYGGAPGVAEAMADRLRAHAPGLRIVGCESPPYRDLDSAELDEVAARINDSGGQVVWVGLGTPRQDYLVPKLAVRVPAAIVPVGAAFDFWAGRVQEAPKALHGTGLEWLYRLSREPRRLWRRYLIGNPRFVASAVRHARVERESAS
jgi:N-acetylglucosaminyldiphosphoundecaprenol N-acetyl-beta-D-mannosaminyltransferase